MIAKTVATPTEKILQNVHTVSTRKYAAHLRGLTYIVRLSKCQRTNVVEVRSPLPTLDE